MKTESFIGERFGRLQVISRAENARSGGRQWLCVCDCGSRRVVHRNNLRSGCTQSCGCLRNERVIEAVKTHGCGGPKRTKAYRSWAHMLGRCTNPKDKNYSNYGGRGISVCEDWHSFENFLRDMGEPAKGLSIERKDNDGNYEPANCKWASSAEQSRNTRRTIRYNGTCLKDACEALSISYEAAQARIRRGQNTHEAIESLIRGKSK